MKRFLGLLFVLIAGCSHFSAGSPADTFEARSVAPARLRLEGELAIAEVQGDPRAMGAQLGALAAEPARSLLSSWKLADFFRSFVEPGTASCEELARVVPDEYLAELDALCSIAGIDSRALLRANAVVDACSCTAFAASGTATGGGPLVVGRNMDFAPANVLGPKTLVTLYRPQGAHAFVSVGWPGFAAVVSGMNEDGLCALVLVNSAAGPRSDAIPLGFCVRRLLERCSTVEAACALFHRDPPASGHFVFLADPRTAAIVSRDAPDRVLEDGLLACTNGRVDEKALVQTDARARCAWDLLVETRGAIDADVARSILAATYLRLENTHAMVFVPAERALLLARGSTFAPAALGHYDRLELAPAFAGSGDAAVTPCDPVTRRFAHWKGFSYPGLLVEQRLARAERRDARSP